MIKKQTIIDLIEAHFEGSDKFIVDIKIRTGNIIEIFIDAPNHILIADCVELSRYVESNLDREKEDFDLQVSSPGLDQPFVVAKQYLKNLGNQVTVTKANDEVLNGELLKANDQEIFLREIKNEKNKISKKKEKIENTHQLLMSEIKETKLIISF